jgi:hypothetical protein
LKKTALEQHSKAPLDSERSGRHVPVKWVLRGRINGVIPTVGQGRALILADLHINQHEGPGRRCVSQSICCICGEKCSQKRRGRGAGREWVTGGVQPRQHSSVQTGSPTNDNPSHKVDGHVIESAASDPAASVTMPQGVSANMRLLDLLPHRCVGARGGFVEPAPVPPSAATIAGAIGSTMAAPGRPWRSPRGQRQAYRSLLARRLFVWRINRATWWRSTLSASMTFCVTDP